MTAPDQVQHGWTISLSRSMPFSEMLHLRSAWQRLTRCSTA